MRTFGQRTTTESADMSNLAEMEADRIESQLPTVDVEGRFTYQTESQVESAAFDNNRLQRMQSSSMEQLKERVSSDGLTSEQEDVFILLEEPQIAESVSEERMISMLRGSQQHREVYLSPNERPVEASSSMRDECSHSSSPIAYGFMRSTPSETTLSSSATITQNQYIVNGAYDVASNQSRVYAGRVRQMSASLNQYGLFRATVDSNSSRTCGPGRTDQQHSTTGAYRKQSATIAPMEDGSNVSTSDEQTFISRL